MLLISIHHRVGTVTVVCILIHTNEKGVQDGWLVIMTEACEREARSLALEKAYVHQVYQQISGAADSLPDRGRAWPRVRQFLSDLEPGSLVCDVGCGNGKYLDVNPSVFEIGADRCKRLTEVAREKEHEVLMCDNLALPFRDESFDAVLSIAVVHHFATTDRRVQALRELARVLRIGGKLIISVWAMEQRHRKFESQDVLVPWHRPQHLSTPSLEFTSTTTTTTSEEDGPPPYHAYTQTSDSESARSQRTSSGVRKRGRSRHKGRSIDPARPLSSSQSSSSLSSPNETCYSFVRRALQKLAGGKRGGSGRHRPWFLETWSTCTKDPPPRRYDPDGCEDIDIEDIQDLPIELRRLEEEIDLPQRRQTFACSERLSSSVEISLGYKSKSLSDILTVNQKCMVRSRSSVSSLGSSSVKVDVNSSPAVATTVGGPVITSQPKPKLVKQKQSLCEEEMEDEGGDQPTDMRDLVKRLPEFKVSISGGSRRYGSVFKQSSMNEELMSTERLREKERVRQNIQKQASLNEEFLFRRQRTFDSLRDTLFSTSTARRFQLLKDGLTNKIKNSTTGIEKVAGASFKNGFVRILQGWKGDVPATQPRPTPTPPTPPPHELRRANTFEDKNGNGNGPCCTTSGGERRHSKEDGSDSSKDSSLQSDTSVDSEDSFASVIFIPKPDLTSETSPPTNTSPPTVALSSPTLQSLPQSPQPTSPKLKTSLPTSPKFKYHSPTSPIIKQPSLPGKYQTPTSPNFKTQLPTSPIGLTKQHSLPTSPKFKYQMPPLSPGFNKPGDSQVNFQQKLNILNFQQKAHSSSFSITRQTSLDVVDTCATQDPPNVKTPPSTVEPSQSPKLCVQSEEVAKDIEVVKKTEQLPDCPKTESQIIPVPDSVKPKAGVPSRQSFPLVRRSATTCGTTGRQENLAKPLPKLLSLELFNPETDDIDSDSSGVSSPDSVSSVISVLTEELSVESHDAQLTKPSPSDGHSNSTSNSINDSDLNLSDQSISSLPNSKSPEFLTSKSPENISKSPESTSKSSDTSNNSKSSETKKLEASKGCSKSPKSFEYLSSSSESLSKSPEIQKEADDSKQGSADKNNRVVEIKVDDTETKPQKPKVPERSSSKSPELMKIKATMAKQAKEEALEKQARNRDEKFVTAACERAEDRSISPTSRRNKSSSPSKTLIEAAADVASSLEGAVDAVIQSSPRAKRRQLQLFEAKDPMWVVEGDFIKKNEFSPADSLKDEDVIAKIFKKCEVKPTLTVRHDIGKKRSPEYLSSHDEPYPDFEFCKIKCHEERSRTFSLEKCRTDYMSSIENMPLLSSFDHSSSQSLSCYDSENEFLCQRLENERLKKEKRRRNFETGDPIPRSLEAGSSWSLGRNERFRSSLFESENQRRQKNSSTWSLNRYETIAKIPLGEFHSRNRYRQEYDEYSDVDNGEKWVEKFDRTPPVPERPIVRIIHEDMSVSTEDEEVQVRVRQRRNYRSHSLSLHNKDRIQPGSWDEECRQHLADFADKLSEKLLAEIDQYREQATHTKQDSRPISSSLPAGLEHINDPYLTRLSEELLDLTRLSEELKERNTYLASLSDEDINKELKLSNSKTEMETNPFLLNLKENDVVSSSNPFSSRLDANPFLMDPNDFENDPFSCGANIPTSNSDLNFDDSFVPFEIDSPPKNRRASIVSHVTKEEQPKAQSDTEKAECRTIEGSEDATKFEKSDELQRKSSVQNLKRLGLNMIIRPAKEKRQNLLFIKSASLDDSHKVLTKPNERPIDFVCIKPNKKAEVADVENSNLKIESKDKNGSSAIVKPESSIEEDSVSIEVGYICSKPEPESDTSKAVSTSLDSNDPDLSLGSRKDIRVASLESSVEMEGSGIHREMSRVTITSSLGHSLESSDPEASGGTGSGSECSRRDVSRVTASTASLGHSMESSDPGDVSERTGSGSDFSRKETSSAGTGRTAGSTASLGPESSSDCSKDARYADRRTARCDGRSSSEETPRRIQLVRQKTALQEPLETLTKTESFETSLNGSTSQESLPSDNGGGAITFHRYYHVFREGELDQLIEKYVDNLHIISSYYDHANWCVIAEKVQVWTI